MKPPNEPGWKTARAICETTDAVELGAACTCTARYETPRNIAIASVPRTPSVFAAFFPCGWRKALTPFAIASTPVSAVEPDENARRRTKTVTAPVPAASGLRHDRVGAGGPSRARTSPTATSDEDRRRRTRTSGARTAAPTPARRAGSRARSRRGRRARAPTLCELSDGANDVIAKIPAEIETATVST